MNVEGRHPLFVRTGYLRVRAWFGIFENLAVDVLLGALFIDQCKWRKFPTEQKLVPWHSRPVEIISMKNSNNSVYADIAVFNENTKPIDDVVSGEHQSRPVVRQISIPTYTQAAVLVNYYAAGLITIETHGKVVEQRCSRTARGVMDILT